MDNEKVVEVIDVRKSFRVGNEDVEILKGISFDIFKGEFLVILGPSGCGKSTLLHTILGLEGPSAGRITVLGTDIYSQPQEDFRSEFRKKNIGMVYQQANWIRSLNVRENVCFPLVLMGVDKGHASNAALRMLESLGMKDWAEYFPTELSSGQQQRISLARALINDPKIIVADEPTGNLDYQSGVTVMELLSKMSKEMAKTVIMVTHDLEYIKYSDRVVRIFDGGLEGTYKGSEKEKIMESMKFKRGVEINNTTNAGENNSENPKQVDTPKDVNLPEPVVEQGEKPTNSTRSRKRKVSPQVQNSGVSVSVEAPTETNVVESISAEKVSKNA